jgi:N-acetylneuraminic acid mutarotase
MNLGSLARTPRSGVRGRRLAVALSVGTIVALALVASLASLALAALSFPDVPTAHPHYTAINDLASRGIIGGYQNGDFGPNDQVKRQQFAKMAVLAAGYPVSESDVCTFVDVDKGGSSDPFPDNYIAVCAAKGITQGKTATTFDPYNLITRLQATSMVVRMANNLQPGLLATPTAEWTGNANWGSDPTHGVSARFAEYNGLLAGLDLATLSPSGNMTRGEVAQVLHNLLGKLAAGTTTTSGATTTTSGPTTTTTAPPGTWTKLNPAGSSPASRVGSSMVYDAASGKVIMFGGADAATAFNDTWAYSPGANTWTKLDPAGSLPPARSFHSMVYDLAGGGVILFGGVDGRDVALGDTWAYDPTANTWADLNPGSAPSGRFGQSMVYNSATGKVILFGGSSSEGSRNDTWAYDLVANDWNELDPVGNSPAARLNFGMVYDSAAGKVILFGGMASLHGTKFADTWAYDRTANTWTALEPIGARPSVRRCHSMVYDSAVGKAILFGGLSEYGAGLNDTWAYDPAANTWTDLKPAGSLPPARTAHRVAYDSATGRVILFGGFGLYGTLLNDVWAYGR